MMAKYFTWKKFSIQVIKHTNLDDVEQTVILRNNLVEVQAKAYIVEKSFFNFPKGTRLAVTQVLAGETTVFHDKLLEEPVVLTKGELARCKIESELIDFNASLNLRGRTAQISE